MKLNITFLVSKGINKAQCDDSALLGSSVFNDESGCVTLEAPACIVLCDGVGGNAGGQEASLFVCKELSGKTEITREELLQLNDRLIQYGRQAGKPQMATTLAGIFFGDRQTTLVNAGNTRLYAYRGRFLNQLTQDHTTYQWLKQTGNEEGAESCNRSEIYCAFGGGRPDYVNSVVVEEVFGGRMPKQLIMTTDGIHDYLTADQMEEILNVEASVQEKIARMIDDARDNGSCDDCSVLIIKIEA